MKFTHLVQFVYSWQDMHGYEFDEVRDATPADVIALTKI